MAANNRNHINEVPTDDEMDFIYDNAYSGQIPKAPSHPPDSDQDPFNQKLRTLLSKPQKLLKERLTDISLTEFHKMLNYIYEKQDYNGSLVSKPGFLRLFLRKYISVEEQMWDPNNLEEANMLLHEFVSTHIEMLFNEENL